MNLFLFSLEGNLSTCLERYLAPCVCVCVCYNRPRESWNNEALRMAGAFLLRETNFGWKISAGPPRKVSHDAAYSGSARQVCAANKESAHFFVLHSGRASLLEQAIIIIITKLFFQRVKWLSNWLDCWPKFIIRGLRFNDWFRRARRIWS